MTVNPEKHVLIKDILAIEEEMFTTVNHGPGGGCGGSIEGFRMRRKCQFLTWPEPALKSYQADLGQAKADGLNLMTLKYACMAEQIEPLKDDPVLDDIAARQLAWQREVEAKFPYLIARGRPVEDKDPGAVTSFLRYLRSELETYGLDTLHLLWAEMRAMAACGDNMNEELYRHLAAASGYESLEQAEAALRKRAGG